MSPDFLSIMTFSYSQFWASVDSWSHASCLLLACMSTRVLSSCSQWQLWFWGQSWNFGFEGNSSLKWLGSLTGWKLYCSGASTKITSMVLMFSSQRDNMITTTHGKLYCCWETNLLAVDFSERPVTAFGDHMKEGALCFKGAGWQTSHRCLPIFPLWLWQILHFMVLLFSHSKHICEMMWKCKEHETGNFGIIIQWRSFFSLWWSSDCEIRSCIVDWRLVRRMIGDWSPRLEKPWKLIMFEMHPSKSCDGLLWIKSTTKNMFMLSW